VRAGGATPPFGNFSGGGGEKLCLNNFSTDVPSNGGRPVSRKKRVQPRPYRSARISTECGFWACSGAM
jgi:hypothetical protein